MEEPKEAKKTQSCRTHSSWSARVVHYFEEDGTRQGYFGVVIGLVPGTRTWFNISYDEEGDEEIHTFELLDDYRDGDLEILYS